MKNKKILAGILAASMLLLSACADSASSISDAEPSAQTTQSANSDPTTAQEPVTDPVATGVNPLTGETGYNNAAVGKRPVAVMINNLKGALPQYGIAAADIIYEVPVEGGITRMMAVYADYTAMPDVCSVRSCRYYYPILAYGMDAIYCHWGADQTIATDTLKRLGIDHIDGGNNGNGVIFFRDEERAKTYASEHTGYLKGSAVAEALESKFGYRTDTTSGSAFSFLSTPAVPQGAACNTANLPFSDSYFSTFTYDAASKTYLKQHSGKPHMDSHAGTQLAFTNVLVLQTNVATRADGYLMDVGLTGGSGYYISNGAAQNITWKKTAESEPITLYDASGAPLSINPGKSYIGLIGTNRTISIS